MHQRPDRMHHLHSPLREQISRYDPMLIVLAFLIIILPFIPADINSLRWHGAKTVVFEIGGALLLGMTPYFRLRQREAPLRLPLSMLVFLSLLMLLAGVSFLFSPNKGFSFNGWWQIAAGLIVTGVVSVRTLKEKDIFLLWDALAVAAILISFYTFAVYQSQAIPVAEGPYHDHQLLGAVLMILTPLTLALFIAPTSTWQRTLGSIAFLTSITGLLLSQNRSSWLAEAVGLLFFGLLLLWRKKHLSPAAKRPLEGYGQSLQNLLSAMLFIGVLGYFLLFVPQSRLLEKRALTLMTSVPAGQDVSEQWRIHTWHGALQMIQEKPWRGWDVGSYSLYQQPFTGQGDSQDVIQGRGARLGDETHNSYLQYGVELGLPGLVLWLLTLASSFWIGVRALARTRDLTFRLILLIGCLSALAGQAVDAFANPAWQFGEVTIFLWVVLGTLTAVSGQIVNPGYGAGERKLVLLLEKSRPLFLIACPLACLWALYEVLVNARYLPTPHL